MKRLFVIIVICLAMASCKKDSPQDSFRMNCDGKPYIECVVYSEYQASVIFYFYVDGNVYKFNHTIHRGENKFSVGNISAYCPDSWGFIKMDFQ